MLFDAALRAGGHESVIFYDDESTHSMMGRPNSPGGSLYLGVLQTVLDLTV